MEIYLLLIEESQQVFLVGEGPSAQTAQRLPL